MSSLKTFSEQNGKTAASVREMVKAGNVVELRKCFGARMEFGTAGLRAAMGPGVSRMNDLTIIQTTQVRLTITTGRININKHTAAARGHTGLQATPI